MDRIGFIIPRPSHSWIVVMLHACMFSSLCDNLYIHGRIYASILCLPPPPRHGSRGSPGPLLACVYPMTSVLLQVYLL